MYKGLWHGTVVAVKYLLLPTHLSGNEKRERMALMEAAISTSLSHPNIVQVGWGRGAGGWVDGGGLRCWGSALAVRVGTCNERGYQQGGCYTVFIHMWMHDVGALVRTQEA